MNERQSKKEKDTGIPENILFIPLVVLESEAEKVSVETVDDVTAVDVSLLGALVLMTGLSIVNVSLHVMFGVLCLHWTDNCSDESVAGIQTLK